MAPGNAAQRYHQETKHHPRRTARSLGYMDWANQPDPFRRFHGVPAIPLRLGVPSEDVSYDDLLTGSLPTPRSVTIDAISDFLEHALALSAWKAYRDTRWALRINPSSGNLHPTEGYLMLDAVPGIADSPGVYHYAPQAHALEQRCRLTSESWRRLTLGFPVGTFFAGLTSIHWREAWKYGERAFRYCQHDVGHAIATISLAAALQGWHATWLRDLSDRSMTRLLGLDRRADFDEAEEEHPDLLLAVVPADTRTTPIPRFIADAEIESVARATWHGKANRLSKEHVDWPLIDDTAAACVKPAGFGTVDLTTPHEHDVTLPRRGHSPSARRIIKQRRSAVDMDGKTGMAVEAFYLLLDRMLHRPARCPWWSLDDEPRIHLCLFVHRVDGLAPGLYFLLRSHRALEALRQQTDNGFAWTRPSGCPNGLPLYLLEAGDFRRIAGQVSCEQAIAADGAFSLGMIAELEKPLQAHGTWYYRRLFWEAGLVGQVLYLEAEAAELRGTGIGCYFDDLVHELLGFENTQFQSLYHFTIGGALGDPRLTTLPPYGPPADSTEGR